MPYFSYIEEDIISKKEIENIIISKFINIMSTCSICGFNYEKVYDINNPTFYRIFQKINLPKFIFIGFDLLNENDIDLDSNFNLSMETELERRKKYNINIIEILKFNFTLNNEIYYLKGIINTPTYNHFTSFIIYYDGINNNLVKGENYYYDGLDPDYNIKSISDIKNEIIQYNPYIGLYVKS